MTLRAKYKLQIGVAISICICFSGLFLYVLFDMTRNDRAIMGARDDGGTITLERENAVSNVLEDIYLSRIQEAFLDIGVASNDESVPDGIKKYFADFCTFYTFAVTAEKQYTTTLNTVTFIYNAPVIKQYFATSSAEDKLSKAAIVPYYFIKNHNAAQKNQQKEKSVYKAYIDTFVTGRSSLDRQGANVMCLYVYASYQSAFSPKDLMSLKTEIEIFLNEFKTNLGENGDMSIQKTYLQNAKDVLSARPKRKALLGKYKLQPYAAANL